VHQDIDFEFERRKSLPANAAASRAKERFGAFGLHQLFG
jgi:hypothetical protein